MIHCKPFRYNRCFTVHCLLNKKQWLEVLTDEKVHYTILPKKRWECEIINFVMKWRISWKLHDSTQCPSVCQSMSIFPEIKFSIFGIRLFREKQKTNKQTKYTTCTVCKGYRLQACRSVKISDTTCRSSMPREDFRIEHWTLLSDLRELWALGCNWPPPPIKIISIIYDLSMICFDLMHYLVCL